MLRSAACSVPSNVALLGQHFARDEKLLARQTLDRVADEFFRRSRAVHLGGIDMPHPERNAEPNRLDGALARRTASGMFQVP